MNEETKNTQPDAEQAAFLSTVLLEAIEAEIVNPPFVVKYAELSDVWWVMDEETNDVLATAYSDALARFIAGAMNYFSNLKRRDCEL